MFDGKTEAVKLFLCTSISFLVSHLGVSSKYIFLLLTFMALDTVTGWLVNIKRKTWKSNKARWGAVGKIVELMFIGVLYLLDWAFGIDSLKYVGIFYFCICEFASLLENMAGLSSNIPTELAETLEKAKFSFGTKIVKKVGQMVVKWSDREE